LTDIFWNIVRSILIALPLVVSSFLSLAHAHTPEAVLQSDTVAEVGGYRGVGDHVEPIHNSDMSVPFRNALHVDRASVGENSYSAALLWSSATNIKKNDLLSVTLYFRNTTPKLGPLNLDITFQMKDEPYTSTLSSSTPVDTLAWQKYTIPFRAVQAYAAGHATLQIRYGLMVQSFDVGGVVINNYGQVADPLPPSIASSFDYYYPGRGDVRAAWRFAALARIAAYRKGEMAVRVVDATGKVLPAAQVNVEQTKSAFVWSTAASAISMVCKVEPNDSARECPPSDQLSEKPVTAADYRKFRALLLKNFNAVSFYNDLKWTEWQNDKQLALDGIEWLKHHKMPLARGHNLIWPSFEPDYMMPKEIINRKTAASDMKRIIADHFADEVGKLRGQVPEWDVVNEPFANTDIQGRIATPNAKEVKGVLDPSAVATWFKDTRKYDPKALLFLNDFSILETLNPTAEQYDLALVKYLKRLGGPIDGIGFQGHFGVSGPVFNDMQRVINDFSPMVKTFSITEFDYTTIDPRLQADLMEDFMTFIYSQPKFNLFQMWGFWDGDHWLGNAPIYNRDWSLKPSGEVWQRLTQQTWRTREDGVTDQAGYYKVKAFYGDYNITVKFADKTCVTQVSFTKSVELILPSSC
jgi:endo-1,4-beta-xylanase